MADLTREGAVKAMADVVLRDLRDRKGVGDELDGIEDADPEIYEEIRQAVGNAALDALLSLLAERGWQVVPVVATEDMLADAWYRTPTDVYQRMLAAAPAPLSEETPHGR